MFGKNKLEGYVAKLSKRILELAELLEVKVTADRATINCINNSLADLRKRVAELEKAQKKGKKNVRKK